MTQPPTPLGQIDVTWRGSTMVASLAGEIDGSNASEIGSVIAKASEAATTVVVDLSALGYLDSTALTMIHRLAMDRPSVVLVAPVGSRANRLVGISGLDTVLPLVENVNDALALRTASGAGGSFADTGS